MWALSRIHPKKSDRRVVGYIDRRTGEILCVNHGARDIESRGSPWAAIRVVDSREAGHASTVAVICRECGNWLNDESTGYAIVAPQDDYGPPSPWPRR